MYYGWHKTVNGSKWYKVRISGSDYYMSANYLKPEVLVKYQAKSNVNYRTGAGTSHAKKGQFQKGASVAIVRLEQEGQRQDLVSGEGGQQVLLRHGQLPDQERDHLGLHQPR